MGVKLPLYPLISTENGEKCIKSVWKCIKIFFLNLCFKSNWMGIVEQISFTYPSQGVKLPPYSLISTRNWKKCLKNVQKIYKKFFFQLYSLNYIREVLPNKYQLLTLYKGVKLPLYPLVSSRKRKKCIKNVKKRKNNFCNSKYE